MENYENEKGVWRTVSGRRIFIRSGESLGSAMARSGKFKREDIRFSKRETSTHDRLNKLTTNNEGLIEGTKRNKKITQNMARQRVKKQGNDTGNQAEKNRIHEEVWTHTGGRTRVERNVGKYSETDQRELRHEYIQKKLADYKKLKEMQKNERERMQKGFDNKIGSVDYDKMSMEEIRIRNLSDEKFKKELKKNIAEYKAKKQSNNKIEPKETIEDLNKLSRSELDDYDRGHIYKDSNVAAYVRNKTLYQETGLQKHYDAMKEAERKYNESKQSNNKQETIKKYVEKKQSNKLKPIDRNAKFDSLGFEKTVPHEMRWKETYSVNDGKDLYWVTQEPFTRKQLDKFTKSFSKQNRYEKAYITVRDFSNYDYDNDRALKTVVEIDRNGNIKDKDYKEKMSYHGWKY